MRHSPCPARRSVLTTVVTPVTTTSFKVLEGAQWFGLCPVSLMHWQTQTRDAPLALLAGVSNQPQTRDAPLSLPIYVPLHYLEAVKDTTVKWNTTAWKNTVKVYCSALGPGLGHCKVVAHVVISMDNGRAATMNTIASGSLTTHSPGTAGTFQSAAPCQRACTTDDGE